MQSFNHSTIQPFNHPIIQSSNHPIIQSSNQAIKQSSNATITFIAFTKTDLKIPYFLLFPLSLTLLFPLLLTRTTFLNHLIP
ncbi:hypothetical protein BGL68_06625 [Helicobacter pylori]|nr:hypothetical protein BGL68_06625 [Helicobacter pylori]